MAGRFAAFASTGRWELGEIFLRTPSEHKEQWNHPPRCWSLNPTSMVSKVILQVSAPCVSVRYANAVDFRLSYLETTRGGERSRVLGKHIFGISTRV